MDMINCGDGERTRPWGGIAGAVAGQEITEGVWVLARPYHRLDREANVNLS